MQELNLIDQIADKLGVASVEIVKAVDVLAGEYALACWVSVGICLMLTAICMIAGYLCRKKQGDNDEFVFMSNDEFVFMSWVVQVILIILFTAIAGKSLFLAMTARLQVLEKLL